MTQPRYDTPRIHSTPALKADIAQHRAPECNQLAYETKPVFHLQTGPDFKDCSGEEKLEMWINIHSTEYYSAVLNIWGRTIPLTWKVIQDMLEHANQNTQYTQHPQGASFKSKDKQVGANLSRFISSPGLCHKVGGRFGKKDSCTCSQTSYASN